MLKMKKQGRGVPVATSDDKGSLLFITSFRAARYGEAVSFVDCIKSQQYYILTSRFEIHFLSSRYACSRPRYCASAAGTL